MITIKVVSSPKELRRFVEFPNKLYRENKFYVPQLVSADMAALDPKKNHAFEFCEAKYWLAYNEQGEIVGRIAGIINREYNKKTGISYARFGWLDFIDDHEVVTALFNAAESWAKKKGMQIVSGPLGFLEFDASGVLVEGFDEYPTAYGKYNFPYYEEHIKQLGYVKDTDWIEFQVTVPEVIPEVYGRFARMIEEKENLHVVQFKSKRDLSLYFDRIFDLLNQAYRNIHGFSELSQGQIDDLKSQFVPQVNLDFISVVANEKDEVVGFGICLPSLSLALQKAHGKLFPFGFIHILKALRKNDTLDTLLISIADDYRNKGVNSIIFDHTSKGIIKHGIKYIETTRELENNHNVINLWGKFETRLHKRARCYIKELQ